MSAGAAIRLIALDLDQTVFGNDLVVRPRLQGVLARVRSLGTAITIATGRDVKLTSRFAREMNVTAPIICVQGGCIYDHAREQVLRDVRLKPELLPRIVEAADRYGWSIHFEAFDRNYLPAKSSHPPRFFELLRYSNWVRVGNLLRDMPEPPHKFIVTLPRPEDRARIVAEMQEALGHDATIVPSHPHLVEGLPAGVNKGHSLAWLAGHLAVAQDEVLAIGDSDADVPMIKWAGVGVAMGNGSAAAKGAADWVAPTLEEDGAAAAIERFCLGSPSAS
ncbi:MAG TPA: Cof-type HAD-IIB family hydrolase [Candidatus Paceibacterota bacterium]|nr:Cof-type HAD-IIB family hydrolase [Candidatus Paceibacterota bacterium]